MSKARITAHAPVLLVSDFAASLAYWTGKVGFSAETYGEPADFAILTRDGARLMLSEAPAGHGNRPNWKIVPNMWNVYFWVDDARAIYDELVASGADIDYELGEKPYGVLEFGIQDPDGHDIAFGQVLNPA
ncbi:MAG: VOC family protein [Flavobacteriaceae bacterium]